MHESTKPVRKCHSCKLNLGERCAVFRDPHQEWKPGKCRGFGDEALYEAYLAETARHPPDVRKEARRERAKQTRTEPHHDGTLQYKAPIADRRRAAR